MTNWYKKSQYTPPFSPTNIQFNWTTSLEEQESGWDRFSQVSGTPWKYVVEMDVGKPTEKEKYIIIEKGLYNKAVSPETIEYLKKTSIIE